MTDVSEPQERSDSERIRALEQLIAPMFEEWAARDPEGAAAAVGAAGTAAPVVATAEPDSGGPWSWAGIDRERLPVLAKELTEFVAYLTTRYLNHLSPESFPFAARWFENPIAVEILTAVMVAHQAAYSDYKTEPSRELADWHEHVLWPALERMSKLRLFPDGQLRPINRNLTLDQDAYRHLAGVTPGAADQADAEQTPSPRTEPINLAVLPTGPIRLPDGAQH